MELNFLICQSWLIIYCMPINAILVLGFSYCKVMEPASSADLDLSEREQETKLMHQADQGETGNPRKVFVGNICYEVISCGVEEHLHFSAVLYSWSYFLSFFFALFVNLHLRKVMNSMFGYEL